MQKFIAILVLGLSFASVSHAQSANLQAGYAIGSLGFDTGKINAGGVTKAEVTGADRAAAIRKFSIQSPEQAVLVGFSYRITDTEGGKLEGWLWSKALSNPTPQEVYQALSSLNKNELDAMFKDYAAKKKAGFKAEADERARKLQAEQEKNRPLNQDEAPATQPTAPVTAKKAKTTPAAPASGKKQPASVVEVIMIGADWCGYCRQLKAMIPDLEAKFGAAIKITYIDSDKNPGAKSKYNATSTPTVIFFRDGQVLRHCNGSPGRDGMFQLLEQYTRQ